MSTVAPIETRVGHYSTDELRFRGHRVFAELLGRATVGQMIVLGITGKLLEGDDLATIDDIITAMSSADPRLWPFKITRLASAYGNGAYGLAATLVAGEGGTYGSERVRSAADWLERLRRNDATDDEIASELEEGAPGFGVLYRMRDERFAALIRRVTERGRHELPFTGLCLRAVNLARARKRLEVHVSLAIAALGLDLGMSSHEVAMFWMMVVAHDSVANACEGAVQTPAALQELPCTMLEYRGREARASPRAQVPAEALSSGDEVER